MATSILRDDYRMTGNLVVEGTFSATTGSLTNASIASNADIDPAKIGQDTLRKHHVPLTSLRVWDAITTLLPAAGATDDLGLVGGTFGTNTPLLKTSDAKATTVTQYARFQWALPGNYDDGETVVLRIHGGMETTVSDGTATVDVECYESNKEGGLGSDLCTTAATTINSLTAADVDFTISAAGLVKGDELDVRITVAITDAATGTAVTGEIGSIAFCIDTRG